MLGVLVIDGLLYAGCVLLVTHENDSLRLTPSQYRMRSALR